MKEFQKVMETIIRVFGDTKLHKLHSNVKELDNFSLVAKPDISYGKQELRTQTSASKILGMLCKVKGVVNSKYNFNLVESSFIKC